MLAKRISLSLLAIAMVSLVVSAASFALFSAQSANVDNTFTAGTVTLETPSLNIVDVYNIAPGDSGTMNYSIEYSGSLDAWIGIDTASSGDLFTCDGGGHFTIDLQDAAMNSYSANAADQVVGIYSQGDTLDLTVNWALALAAGNDCQGDSATMQLMVKAVQSKNNTNVTNTGPNAWN
ncbi:MAG: TasA family protein [Bacillota bacterium]